MTPNRIKDSLNYQTCLCCMCRCGDHKCFQQLALELPSSMQQELVYDDTNVRTEVGQKKRTRQADLYRKTIYRQDYCEQPDIMDRYPLEHERHRDNMRFSSTFGHPVIDSTYRDDFIPWSERDQALCRAKLHVPDHMLKTESTDAGRGDASRRPTQAEYDYYCPPHCRGDQNPEKRENCLVGHERLFNLGPPARRTCSTPEKSPHPFAKYSNYMLDYKGSKIPPKRRVVRGSVDIDEPQYPMSSKTTYKDAFSRAPKMGGMPRKKEGQVDNLTVGDGPMIQESTSMVDFRDPDVRTHKPERPPRPVYQPPACSMETTTTTGSTYKRWEDLPVQVKPQSHSKAEDRSFQQYETDGRRLITTYQEDFDGINSALCPCRVVEKYGPRVLEPRYSYRKSNSLHDMFCSEIRAKICPH